jgi:hypothetical protein
MERALGGAKLADPRLVSAKRSTTHSSGTSWEPPLKSRHWNAASQSQPANTHAFLYYRKGKNKNTKFKQATLSGILNSTRKLVTLRGFPSLVIVFPSYVMIWHCY